MVGILTDTTASIPEKLTQRLGIVVVPYYVHRGLETLRDVVDVKPGEFAEWLKGASQLPTTSNPAPGDYMVGLKNLAGRVKEIVVLTMTSKGSGAYQSCLAAVEMLQEQVPDVRVEVVDTLQVVMSVGTTRSRLKAYRRMVELMQQRVGEGARIKVAFTHVIAQEQLEKLRAMVTDRFDCVEVIVTELSPALAVHSGPGTVGVSFFPT